MQQFLHMYARPYHPLIFQGLFIVLQLGSSTITSQALGMIIEASCKRTDEARMIIIFTLDAHITIALMSQINQQANAPCSILVGNFLALLTDSILTIHIKLGGGALRMAFTVSLDILNKLSDTEEVVHLLKRQALGLRDEEPDEEEHGETERAVDKKGTKPCQYQGHTYFDRDLTYP